MSKQQDKFDKATELHQLGRFNEAIELYKDILPDNINNAQFTYLLGTAYFQAGQIEKGIDLTRISLKLDSSNHAAYNNLGNALRGIKSYAESLNCYDRAIALNPQLFQAHNNRGIVLHDLKRLGEAVESYQKAILLRPNYHEAYFNLGITFRSLQRLKEALVCFDKAIALRGDSPQSHNHRGLVLSSLKRQSDALAAFEHAISLNTSYAEAYYNCGNILTELERFDEALGCFDRAIALSSNYAEAYFNRGNVLAHLKRNTEALSSFDKSIHYKPDFARAHSNRGCILIELNQFNEALLSLEKAITLNPELSEAYYNHGNALRSLGCIDDAIDNYNKAITLRQEYPEALVNRGIMMNELNRQEEALENYCKALTYLPTDPEIYINRGCTLAKLRRLDQALTDFNKAISLKPDLAEAYNNRGLALADLYRPTEALSDFDKAISLKSDHSDAYYNNRGIALLFLKRQNEALESLNQAFALNPDYEFLLGKILHVKMSLCDWTSLDEYLIKLVEGISSSKLVCTPFELLGIIDSPQLHQNAAKLYADSKYPVSNNVQSFFKRPENGRKIRIAYYSADFYNHATAVLMAELLEEHDSSKYQVFGFTFGPEKSDELQMRVSSNFDRIIDIRNLSDREVAKLSRDLEIDIAIDLKGYTRDHRFGIFTERAAPIQVSYLGYPGTLGAQCIDYLIADTTVVPADLQHYYSEKIVYFPHSYQCNDSKRHISERHFTKLELGLPADGFVFCCFNNNYKISPPIFEIWMRILRTVKGSVLWLLEDNATAAINLRKEAVARGVDCNRLVFAKRMTLDDHLARHRLADLFIDTLPCNAHTTASDALWAGLPVLTCIGMSFASRVAASLLNAIRLPELITYSLEEYESKAIELATHPEKLSQIKSKLDYNKNNTLLFDGKQFARYIEAAYQEMYERHLCGLPLEDIEISC